MPQSAPAKLVTVFGGSGFVGRNVMRALAKRGYRVRAAVRRPDLAGHLQPLGTVGQIAAVQANLRYRWSIDRAVDGADAVVNAVGILHETGRQKFDGVQAFGARAVADATREAGVPLIHVSAIGADPASQSNYARSKGEGENSVREILPEAVIMRPSIVFGPEDDFFNRFAAMSRLSPVLPLIGGGTTRFQPVYVGDVAEAIARAVDGDAAGGTTHELGGPEIATFRECLELMLDTVGRKRALVSVPFMVARAMGWVGQWLPKPSLTADQVILLRNDNVVSEAALAENRTLDGLGIAPRTMKSVLPTYLVQYRKHGQFDSARNA